MGQGSNEDSELQLEKLLTKESSPGGDVNERRARQSELIKLTDAGYHALTRYRQLHSQRDLDEAITCFERARDMCPPDHPNRCTISFNLATTRFIHCQDNVHYHDLDVPVTLYQDALQLHTLNCTDRSVTALDLCFAILVHLRRQGAEADLTGARDLHSITVESYAYRAAWLALQLAGVSVQIRDVQPEARVSHGATTGDALMQRTWGKLGGSPDQDATLSAAPVGQVADIREAISLECAERIVSDGYPGKPGFLNCLGAFFHNRFERFGDIEDIEKSVSKLEEAVRLTPDTHPNKLSLLNNLGISLRSRFERIGDLADMDMSISISQEVVRLTPDDNSDKPNRLNQFGNSLSSRFERFGDLADINNSIFMHREAARLTPDGHPDKPARLNHLANALSHSFHRIGVLADLNDSIDMLQKAVRLTPTGHPNKPAQLNNLGTTLCHRFERLGVLADINRSILMKEEAVCLTPDDHPDKPNRLSSLGTSLMKRYERRGDVTDIRNSISALEKAVFLTPDGHPDKPCWLSNLGRSLAAQCRHTGDLVDINKSIRLLQEAVCLTPNPHPDRPSRVGHLGASLSYRFRLLGELTDVDHSVLMCEEAVRLTPDDHPDKPSLLHNLLNSLYQRFERLGNLADIDDSVLMAGEAVRLTPDGHPEKPILLNLLGKSLSIRFEHLRKPSDINKSVSVNQEAVDLTPDGHFDKPIRLDYLGGSLLYRFQTLHNHADIDGAVSMFEEALRLTSDDHPHKPIRLNNLGNALVARFLHSGSLADLSAASSHFSIAATGRANVGITSVRFHAAYCWILSARLQNNSRSIHDAYATAINLLPQFAWIGLPLKERHRVLLEAANVARDAAAAALDTSRPETAVEWLEQGRSIVWSQFLELRAPVDELRVKHPGLADRFRQICQQLEYAGSRGNSSPHSSTDNITIPVVDTGLFEEEVQRHHDLALRREEHLGKIRSLSGFGQFLLPKTIEQLTSQAHSAPVVYLNASIYRCDALIIMAKMSVTHIALPGINYLIVQYLLCLLLLRNHPIISRDDISTRVSSEDSLAQQRFLDTLIGEGTQGSSREGVKIEKYNPEDRFRLILAFLWKNVVRPVLETLGISTPPSDGKGMTRLLWCPTGPLAFLPIHAAGLYDRAKTGPKLSDFVISSYIPTLNSLSPAARKDPLSSASPNVSLVAVPQPPGDGQERLPGVETEIDHIKTLSTKSHFVSLQVSCGTVEDVMEKMASADWVHFACHGVQDRENPLDSGLCLVDGRLLKLSDIIRLSCPQGGLAFLSACQTAKGDEKLSEESVHLAAGMLLAGYGSVIATMWSIMDRDAPKVTRRVYEHLFRDGKAPDSTEAAEALHYAIQELRESGASFSSWVPFIHVGY